MAVVVEFNTGKRDLRAVAGEGVKGVLMFANDDERQAFLDTFHPEGVGPDGKPKGKRLKPKKRRVPDEVTLFEGDVQTSLDDEEGPPVCYWIRGELVCWSS